MRPTCEQTFSTLAICNGPILQLLAAVALHSQNQHFAMVCRSQLLHSATTTLPDNPWQLNPSFAGFITIDKVPVDHSQPVALAPIVPDRYYSSTGSAAPAQPVAVQRRAFEEFFERHLCDHPRDEEKWMAFALEHLSAGGLLTSAWAVAQLPC